MVSVQNKLNGKIQELVNLRLNKGVSPVELAANIYNDEYSEIKLKRKFGKIVCNVFFYDQELFGENKVKYEYVYTYNEDLFLEEIQQKKGKQTTVTWNRKKEEEVLVRDIAIFINETESKDDVQLILNTFPKDLKKLIQSFIFDEIMVI